MHEAWYNPAWQPLTASVSWPGCRMTSFFQEAGGLPALRRSSGLDETFGQRLRAARLGAHGGDGYGQTELARALGISQATVSDYERGRRRPPLGMLVRLAEALGVSVGWLLTATPEQAEENPAILQRSLAGLLGLTTLTWLGTAVLYELPGTRAGNRGRQSDLPREHPDETTRAAEEAAVYAAARGGRAGQALVLADALCPGARSALVYTGPPCGDLTPGDILFVDPAMSDPGRWRLAFLSGAGPGAESRHTLVPGGTDLPAGLEPRGTVVGLLRRSR